MVSRPRKRPEDERRPEGETEGLGRLVRRILAHNLSPEERLERLLAERRRELDEHAARFEARIADLERREELLGDSRASVERLLRTGTSDLGERESDLLELAQELKARESRLREEEAELMRRRSELGAVELKRAAVEQRERALGAHEAKIADRETRLAARETAARPEAGEQTGPSPLLLFVPGPRYRLVEVEHEPVSRGSPVELEGEEYVVARIGPSPLPGDTRPCAYLVRGAPGPSASGGSS